MSDLTPEVLAAFDADSDFGGGLWALAGPKGAEQRRALLRAAAEVPALREQVEAANRECRDAGKEADRLIRQAREIADQRVTANEADLAAARERAEKAEKTVKSLAVMLGWANVPPREVLERSLNALRERVERAERERDAALAKLDHAVAQIKQLSERAVESGKLRADAEIDLDAALARATAAEAALVARHGGEPIALLSELDAARTALAEARALLVESGRILGATETRRMLENVSDEPFTLPERIAIVTKEEGGR